MRSLWMAAVCAAACSLPDRPKDVSVNPDPEDPFTIELVPIGPDPAAAQAFAESLDGRPEILAFVQGHRFRQMRFELAMAEVGGNYQPTTAFEAVFWDYDDDRSFSVKGDMVHPEVVTVAPANEQLPPTLDEFEEATRIALQDPQLKADVEAGRVEFFRAMPPTIDHAEGHRVISLGIRPTDDTSTGEIAGADLSAREIIHFPALRPPTSRVGGFVCNPPPYSPGSGPARGTVGWGQVRLMNGGNELWKMNIRRPASSAGPNGSGVELMDVRYQGKRVISRANLPILNVRYDGDVCGPYRDWQWQENPFSVGPTLTQLATGLRVVEWAKTMRETRDDSGNYSGVAIFWDAAHQQMVVLSEIEAGWYRYISEWRFSPDGTINPRFGFDAVQNWCTCQEHFHHAYWRLDFQIGSGANRFEERQPSGSWTSLSTEAQRTRDDTSGREWRVKDNATGDGYRIVPVPGEDAADVYGIADAWFLAAHGTEMDDSGTSASIPTQAGLPDYVNGENVLDTDVLMWWGGHFVHNDADPSTNQTHTVQLLLVPDSW